MFRNPFEFRIRFVLSIIIGVLFGLLFLRLSYNQQAFQNISAVIFMLIINATFSNVQAAADVNTSIDWNKSLHRSIRSRITIVAFLCFSKNMTMEFIERFRTISRNSS